MAMPRVFVSFDFDHDAELRDFLVGQARNSKSPFTLANWSVKDAMSGDWKEKVRTRIRSVDVVLVICGERTDTATGVSAEVRIAREEGKPVYFIKGRPDKKCKLPKAALPTNRMRPWTWNGLAAMLSKPNEPAVRERHPKERMRGPREGSVQFSPHTPREQVLEIPSVILKPRTPKARAAAKAQTPPEAPRVVFTTQLLAPRKRRRNPPFWGSRPR